MPTIALSSPAQVSTLSGTSTGSRGFTSSTGPTHTRGLQRSLVVVRTKRYLYDSTAQTRRSDGCSRPPQPGRHQRSFLGSVADFPGAVRRTGKASVERLATSPTSYLGMGEQPRFSSGFRSLLAIAYSSSKFLH